MSSTNSRNFVSVSSILSHLTEMNIVYNNALKMDSQQLYAYFNNLAALYTMRDENNFAKIVHMLHPVKYAKDIERRLI